MQIQSVFTILTSTLIPKKQFYILSFYIHSKCNKNVRFLSHNCVCVKSNKVGCTKQFTQFQVEV